MPRLLALALISGLVACQPFYRDDLRAGRRAENGHAIALRLDAAERAAAAGDLPGAIGLARAAIRTNPSYGWRGYAVLAINLRRAGAVIAARAIVGYAEAEFGSGGLGQLVEAYAADDLIADAIDHSRATTLQAAAAIPVLTGALSELVEAQGSTKGTIAGITTDRARGHGLTGVTVAIAGAASQTAITDDHGSYRIGDLPPGDYRVTFFYGPQTIERRGITVVANRTTPVFQQIDVSSTAGEVMVIDDQDPTTDSTSTTPGLTIAQEGDQLEVALEHYRRWLDTYGVPDHSLQRDARTQLTNRVGDAINAKTPIGRRLGAIGPRADRAIANADLAGGLALYALAFQLLPDDKFLAYRGSMARAAVTVTAPAQVDPIAWGFAVDGDVALKAGQLGVAIHAYRRAVAHAPWWRTAHGNLAELLALAGRTADADLERAWVAGLAAGGWATEQPDDHHDLDRDGDLVAEAADRCPDQAEDPDGFADDDGCPEVDNDRDLRPDATDRCPAAAEDPDGFEDDDGCPEVDNDRDGILDVVDQCPLQPEAFNGTADTDGCPDQGRVVIGTARVDVLDPIEFEGKTAKLKRSTAQILDAVVATLAGNPQLAIEVGVHGSLLGDAGRDATLTQARADQVVKYLVGHGIASARVSGTGYGGTRPLAPRTDLLTVGTDGRVELVIRTP